jgi:eukaryotic-like serine/threonine-protein kinase
LIEGITPRESSNPSAEIPNLVGVRSIEEAQEAVGDNFIIKGVQVESGEAVGTIVSQDPKAGKMVGKGSTISVEISGKQILPLPNVEGRTLDEAVQSIRGRPFALDVKTRESSAQEENLVVEQDPRGGEGVTAEAGTRVTVTVGEGPAPVKVPDLYNLSPEAAKRVLGKAGLSLGNQTKLPSERVPAGQVVDQLTAPGTEVKPGSSVDIVTSSGPAQVPVLDVTDYDADEYATSLDLAF